MSDRAAQTQRPVDPGLQKGPSVDCRKGGARMGGRSLGWGEPPPKSLEFKNLKPTRLLPPPPSSPADCSVVLSPPSHPPSLSLGVPSPVCLNPSVQHTRSVFAFRESLSVILLLETQSSLTEIIAKGRDGRG